MISPLGELVEIIEGGTPSKANPEYWGGDIPWASVKDLKSSELAEASDYITMLGLEKSAAQIIPAGAVIVSVRGVLGKVAVNSVDMAISQKLKALLVKDESKLSASYLMYFLQSQARFIQKQSAGAIVNGITLDMLREIEVPLPALVEQQRIVAILKQAESIRMKRKKSIEIADDFLRSVFLELFGEPKLNPKSWDTKQWRDTVEIVSGRNQRSVEDKAGAYPVCGAGGVISRAADWLLEENSVIIGRRGRINNPTLMLEKSWNNDTAFGLQPVRKVLSHNYLYWFCRFFNFENISKSSAVPSLSKVDLLQIQMPTPPIELQKKFDVIVDKVDGFTKKSSAFDANTLFLSISKNAFSGKL